MVGVVAVNSKKATKTSHHFGRLMGCQSNDLLYGAREKGKKSPGNEEKRKVALPLQQVERVRGK